MIIIIIMIRIQIWMEYLSSSFVWTSSWSFFNHNNHHHYRRLVFSFYRFRGCYHLKKYYRSLTNKHRINNDGGFKNPDLKVVKKKIDHHLSLSLSLMHFPVTMSTQSIEFFFSNLPTVRYRLVNHSIIQSYL